MEGIEGTQMCTVKWALGLGGEGEGSRTWPGGGVGRLRTPPRPRGVLRPPSSL